MAVSVIDRQRGNLPVDVTSFVGRRREMAEVKDLLSASRLVTLTGMGGVGKTRLALRVAAELRRGFGDGVWLVELAGLRDPHLVAQTVAASLGFQDQSPGRSSETLAELLAPRRLLLVLDNCEHLIDACAVLVDALLRACPDVRILTTSRQPLGIAGEQVMTVPPLSVPDPDRPSSQGLARFDSVNLFVERATAVHPGFAIDSGNQIAVAGICRRLDGIPLALELAAGRLRVLSPQQLLSRLDDRYHLLTGGSRAALPRQQTLQALIDWSFDLCSPAERLLWTRLSVFAGGFDLDSAEQVCSGGEIPAERVLDVLASLVDKSIVTAEDSGASVRYQLSETLRQYGLERLSATGEAPLLRRRHLAWCHSLAERLAVEWFGPGQATLLGALRRAHANLREALAFCLVEPAHAEAGLAMASALRFYWTTSGRLNEGRHWLDRLLEAYPEPNATRLRGLYVDGYLNAGVSDFAAADQRLEEAELLARRLDDVSAGAYVAQVRGMACLFRHEPAEGARYLERALAVHRERRDQAATSYEQALSGVALVQLGEESRAADLLEQCLTETGSAGESWIRSLALWVVGIQALRDGDMPRAISAERESLQLRVPLQSQYLSGLNLDVLAWVATVGGDAERAARLFGAAEAVVRAAGTTLISSGPTSGLHDEYLVAARRALGEKEFDRCFQQGLLMGFADAVAYALGNAERPAEQHPAAVRVGPDSLTRREWQVADLITQGLSNKEIATRLVISQRTAEGHAEHIMTKLGLTSRTQVAAWVNERRRPPEEV